MSLEKIGMRLISIIRKNVFLKISIPLAAVSMLALVFQNCGKVDFSSKNNSAGTCTTPACLQAAAGTLSCNFNNVEVLNGQSTVAYQNSTVPAGQTCVQETRTCANGSLSGTYNFATCTPGGPASCLFNGLTIADQGTVVGYQSSSVAYNQTCNQQVRTCNNGVLSGAYNFASCTIEAPRSCSFNGQNVAHGTPVQAYQNSTVNAGQTCVVETRVCTDGNLSGSYNYGSCAVAANAACLFNGQTVAHGQNVIAFLNSTVLVGQSCNAQNRVCNNGVLSGTYTFASCTAGAPASCTFNGQTIASGQSVDAYQNSTVPAGQTCVKESRTCSNGALSGSYSHASCTPAAYASCTFNGQSIAHGQTVAAFQNSTVPAGQTCAQETRTCNNGTLSGSYTFGSCTVAAAAACTFNGQTIADGGSVMAYQASSVPNGQTCVSQSRVCYNGALSGSYTFASCTVNAPASCLFNGQTIANGSYVRAFQSSTVAYGQNCVGQDRLCQNGVLNGNNFTWASCTVNGPASCQFNGNTYAHNQSVVMYAASSVPYGQSCSSEYRVCNNGAMTGSYQSTSCQVQVPSELWTWQSSFYQTSCPYYCDGMQQVTCQGSGCPGRTYWHYGSSAWGVAPYTPGTSQTTRPPYIGSWYSMQID